MSMIESEIKDFLSLFPNSFMELSIDEQKVSLLLYQLLAKGTPVSLDDIVHESGLSMEEIRHIFNRWGSEVLWDDDKKYHHRL